MTSRRRRDSTPVSRLLAGAALLALATGAVAAAVKSEHVEAELVAARTAIVPGEPFTVALRLKIQDGWHTYWRNPGDSGLPTTLTWTLPEGIAAGPIEWPAPRALPAGPLVNYGYEGDALHLVELKPAAWSQAASRSRRRPARLPRAVHPGAPI
jgi:thiol:disulfide interchange protein DsbD